MCNKDGVLDNFVIKNPEQHFIEIKDERIAWLEKQGEQKQLKDYSTLEITDVVRQALQECESFSNIRADLYAARVGATVENLIKKRSEQKSAWSKEDEVKINRIVACLENLNVADNDILLKDVDWLKALKQRIGG
jgi:molybdopterin converting factor small subunit